MQKKAVIAIDEPPPLLQPLLTIKQVAEILGVSRPTVYELIYNAGLPVVKLGKNVRVLPSSLLHWIAQRERTREEV
jgi:excisionase family DNA binding protein